MCQWSVYCVYYEIFFYSVFGVSCMYYVHCALCAFSYCVYVLCIHLPIKFVRFDEAGSFFGWFSSYLYMKKRSSSSRSTTPHTVRKTLTKCVSRYRSFQRFSTNSIAAFTTVHEFFFSTHCFFVCISKANSVHICDCVWMCLLHIFSAVQH